MKNISIRMKQDEIILVEALAEREGKSRNDYIREIILRSIYANNPEKLNEKIRDMYIYFEEKTDPLDDLPYIPEKTGPLDTIPEIDS